MPRLTTVLLLACLAGCSDPCAGLSCGPCPPALTLTIDAADGAAVTVDGDIALDCGASGATTTCVSHDDVAPGTYAFTIRAPGFATEDVALTLGPGGSGCCACSVEAASQHVDLTGSDGGANATDAGTSDASTATSDAATSTNDASATDCRPERVEFPAGGDLTPGTLCDDVFVCVADETAAAAVEAASSSFDCSGDEGPCGAGVGCAFRDPGGPSTLDAAEIQSICAVTLLEPLPDRIICAVYL